MLVSGLHSAERAIFTSMGEPSGVALERMQTYKKEEGVISTLCFVALCAYAGDFSYKGGLCNHKGKLSLVPPSPGRGCSLSLHDFSRYLGEKVHLDDSASQTPNLVSSLDL